MAQTPEERREANRERMRQKRAAERKAKAAAQRTSAQAAKGAGAGSPSDAGAGSTNDQPARTMRDAVETSLTHMKWLKDSDAASVAQAKILAEDVDLFRHAGEHQKALSAHGRLSRVLNDLGGTPSVRMLRELRSSKSSTQTPGSNDGEEQADETSRPAVGGVVTKFERPKKRPR